MLRIACPNGHKLKVPDRYAGRTIKCPACGAELQVPGESNEIPILWETAPAPAPPAEVPEKAPEPVAKEEPVAKKEKGVSKKRATKKSRMPLIAGGAVAGLLLVVGGVFLFLRGGWKDETKTALSGPPKVENRVDVSKPAVAAEPVVVKGNPPAPPANDAAKTSPAVTEAAPPVQKAAANDGDAKPGAVAKQDSVAKQNPVVPQAPVAKPLNEKEQAALTVQNLQKLLKASHDYEEASQKFMPPYVMGKDGKTTHSWRVALLPYMGYRQLYQQYNQNEPWDSPTNKKVLEHMPAEFRGSGDDPQTTHSGYAVLYRVNPKSVSDESKLKGKSKEEREDAEFVRALEAPFDSLAIVETKRDVPWTKPEDILMTPGVRLPPLGGFLPGKVGLGVGQNRAFIVTTALMKKYDVQEALMDGSLVHMIAQAESELAQRTKNLKPMPDKKVETQRRLRFLSQAIERYVKHQKQYPPAVVKGPDGKTVHSWRVALLPYLYCDELYEQYHLDEPWDSPNNQKVLAQMPQEFRSPYDDPALTNSGFYVVVGPGTMFEPKPVSGKGVTPREVMDRYPLMLAEAKARIPWTKPEDLTFDPEKPFPKLGGFTEGIYNVVTVGGSVVLVPQEQVNDKILIAGFVRNDGEVFQLANVGSKPEVPKPVRAQPEVPPPVARRPSMLRPSRQTTQQAAEQEAERAKMEAMQRIRGDVANQAPTETGPLKPSGPPRPIEEREVKAGAKVAAKKVQPPGKSAGSSPAKSLDPAVNPKGVGLDRYAETIQHLRKISMAAENYQIKVKKPLFNDMVGPNRKALHSWRVALLPYLGHQKLYDEYKLDEPWDSPANKKVLAKMPEVYRSPFDKPQSTNSGYFYVSRTNPHLDEFDVKRAVEWSRQAEKERGEVPKDFEKAWWGLMLVESKWDIPWTKPEDIQVNPPDALPPLGGFIEGKIAIHAFDSFGSIVSDKLLNQPKVRAQLYDGKLRHSELEQALEEFTERESRSIPLADESAETMRRLSKLAEAIGKYQLDGISYPGSAIKGPDGKTVHSWRVAILPFLGLDELYAQYKLDEPWDSPANKKVLAQMPQEFRSPYDDADSTNSGYYGVVGRGTMFDPVGTSEFGGVIGVEDGKDKTLLLIESREEIPWTKPEDIVLNPEKGFPKLGGFIPGKFAATTVDGKSQIISMKQVNSEILTAGVVINDHKPLKLADVGQPRKGPTKPGSSKPPGVGTKPQQADGQARAQVRRLELEQRMKVQENLQKIAQALIKYEKEHGHYPPAAVPGPDGKTLHSWRVAILPQLGRKDLYDDYHFDEPWDSPANKELLEDMPIEFVSPYTPEEITKSAYYALVGPGTAFEGSKGISAKDFPDGLTATILLVEAKRDIPWLKPEDIPYDPDKEVPALGGFVPGKVALCMADARTMMMEEEKLRPMLRQFIQRNDGEIVTSATLRKPQKTGTDPESVNRFNLTSLAVALQSYRELHGSLPEAFVLGPDGKTVHSWRVELLPYLGLKDLYSQYRMDESWDSTANMKVLNQMPEVYKSPHNDPKSTDCGYFAVVGSEGYFSTREPQAAPVKKGNPSFVSFSAFLLVESKMAIPWTKPEEIISEEKNVKGLGGYSDDEFTVVTYGGNVMTMRKQADDSITRSFFIPEKNFSRNGSGNPQQYELIEEYRQKNPTGTPQERQSKLNMGVLAEALSRYEQEKQHFPPAAVMGPDGVTPHSWRVEILPYLNRAELFDQYRMDEPWDSPANKRVLENMPDVFRSPFDDPKSTRSGYFVLVGPGTWFERKDGIKRFEEGNVFGAGVLVLECKRDIPWTKPEDLSFDPKKPLEEQGWEGFVSGKMGAVMSRGFVEYWNFSKMTPKSRQNLMLRNPSLD